MSKINKYITHTMEFPDSGWTLSFINNGDKVLISLHWRDKVIPTHQLECERIDLQEIFKE